MSSVRIEFYVRFYTQPGQALFITGNGSALGDSDPAKALPLQYVSGEFWQGNVEVDPQAGVLRYRYILQREDGSRTEEGGNDRELDFSQLAAEELEVIDTWNYAGEYENVFYTAPFREVLLPHDAGKKSKKKTLYTHVFRVKAPLLKKDEMLCLTGSGISLNEWDTENPILLAEEGNWWTVRLNIPKEELPVQYKYGIYNKKEKQLSRLENGENRWVHGDARQHKVTVLHDGFIHLPNNTWRGAGVAIPVFSLRTKRSFGVGEFTDLKELIDWAVKCGLHLVQILPVNDTTANYNWQDSYPYAAISAFALHPIYLNLEKMAGKKYASIIKPLKKKQRELNELAAVDYEEVFKIKMLAVKELYEIQKEEFEADGDYQEFFKANRHWLEPYAAFCHLRDKYNTPDFSLWRTNSVYDKEAIRKFVAPGARHHGSIALHYFVQYHLHLQLREAADHAHKNGIIMKGDIPIGIYRYSCDAWMAPRLYHLDQQAGAPPDDFAMKGQNWGFPTYNWEEMEKDGFDWWIRRFEQMANYFDGFRIDHILGFFRIWSIPMHAVQGVMGHFTPAIPVYRVEFGERNIWFDHERYTRPFINDAVLWELFGPQSDLIKSRYLTGGENGFYSLKDEVATQRQVEALFKKEGGEDPIRDGLYDLISNVILLDVANSGEQQFHFRIGMEQTSSFRYLDWNTQQQLKSLYVNYFFHRQDNFWEKEAMRKLPALKRSTNMMVFGEDLGMVPHCVPEVMRQLGILSLEIQRMPKNPAREFFNPSESPYLAVVTPSTHDMSTIRGWWEEDRVKTQRFFNNELGQWGEAPAFCEPWVNKAIVLQHLHSPAMWSIFQLQDILGMSDHFRRENPHDERINIPADAHHYWRYRVHITLEELIKERAFNEELREYVKHSGR